MGHRDASAVFCRGNQGNTAGLLEFQLATVFVNGTVRQLGKRGRQTVFQG